MRVVVVGSGIAGLVAAVRASVRHDVVLVTKRDLAESNTRYAQGGIAAALFPDDSVARHIADTMRAGAGLADPHAVEVLCAEGPARVRELLALGVPFDRVDGELVRGNEAAHSVRRVLHAGGDATGLAIESTLVETVRRRAVEIHEHTFLDDLLLDDGRVVGVEVTGPDGITRRIPADVVVLATGGAGRLFPFTTNPEIATGDGVAAAWRAGAVVTDLEFFQFHPTALAIPGTPLVSEAVRGEGAVLRDERGRRFLLDVHPDAELAPRDVVARGIAAAMARQDGRPVLLDATALGEDFLAVRFPGITRACRAAGFDWGREPIPVTPAAHYAMGGVQTDHRGRTTVPGVYAVGEAARTGVHGANRLASNSLLEGLVFAARAVDALEEPDALDASAAPDDARVIACDVAGPGALPTSRHEVQSILWEGVGLERDAAGLSAAARRLALARPAASGVAGREDANLILVGRLMTEAALLRRESRGAHARRDFRATDPAQARSIHLVAASTGGSRSTAPRRHLESVA